MREVRAMQALCGNTITPTASDTSAHQQCPFLVQFLGFWEYRDKIYIQMSFEEKGTLQQLIKSNFFPDESVLRVLYATSAALAYMHGPPHSLVHLDIKPSNLLVTKQGGLRLCDFGKTVPINSPTDDDEGDTR